MENSFVSKELCDERSTNLVKDFERVEKKIDKAFWMLVMILIAIVGFFIQEHFFKQPDTAKYKPATKCQIQTLPWII